MNLGRAYLVQHIADTLVKPQFGTLDTASAIDIQAEKFWCLVMPGPAQSGRRGVVDIMVTLVPPGDQDQGFFEGVEFILIPENEPLVDAYTAVIGRLGRAVFRSLPLGRYQAGIAFES